MKRIFSLLIATGFIAATAFAADEIIRSDKVQVGRGVSSGDKSIVFDTNSGAANPSITTTPAQNDVRIKTNKLKVGTGASADQTIQFNTGGGTPPAIRWNNSQSKVEFTNDGTNFKAIGSGSGSGSGINLIDNSGFEDGISGFASSGGVTVIETSGANLLFGLKSISFDASASGQYFESVAVAVPEILKGKNCMARVNYKFGDGNLDFKVLDGSNVLIAKNTFTAASSVSKNTLNFPCPSSGSIKWRVESTAAAALIALDQVHLGEPDNLFQISQANWVGSLQLAGCSWSVTAGTYADPSAQSCVTIPNGALVPVTGLPQATLPNAKPGTYVVTMTASGQVTNAVYALAYRLYESANNYEMASVYHSTNTTGATPAIFPVTLTGSVQNTTTQTLTFKTQFFGQGPTIAYLFASATSYTMNVYYFPNAPLNGFIADVTNWHIDANIGASTNTPMSLSTVASWTGIEGSDKDLVLNSGSLPAQIPCAGTTPSSGLVCASADESLGIAFDLPVAGKVEACFDFTHIVNSSSGGDSVFQIIQTGNADQNPLLYGNMRVSDQFGVDSIGYPYHVCGLFDFPSAGKKTLRLMYQQLVGGYSQNIIITDRAGSGLGNRDMHITVRPITQNVPYPVLIDKKTVATYTGNTGVTLNGTAQIIKFLNIGEDSQSIYNSSTGIGTIPSNGMYSIDVSMHVQGNTNTTGQHMAAYLVKSNVPTGSPILDQWYLSNDLSPMRLPTIKLHYTGRFAQGDNFVVGADSDWGTTKQIDGADYFTHFSIVKIGD